MNALLPSAPSACDTRTVAVLYLVIDEWKPIVPLQNTPTSFVPAKFPSGTILEEIGIHIADDRAWCTLPARPMIKQDRLALRNEDGKTARCVRGALVTTDTMGVREKYPETFCH